MGIQSGQKKGKVWKKKHHLIRHLKGVNDGLYFGCEIIEQEIEITERVITISSASDLMIEIKNEEQKKREQHVREYNERIRTQRKRLFEELKKEFSET